MRVLFVTPAPPWPPLKGYQVRAYHQLRRLSVRHDVRVLSLVSGPPTAEAESQVNSVCSGAQFVAQRPAVARPALWRAPFSRVPTQALWYVDRGLEQALQQQLESFCPDVVHLQLARLGEYIPIIRDGGTPIVLDLIDALSLNLRRRAAVDGRMSGMAARWEASRLATYERTLCSRVNAALVVSDRDRVAIGAPNLHVVPLGVDPSSAPLAPGGRPPATLVFSGNMGYFPNADAAEWLVECIFPGVRAACPDAALRLVGVGAPRQWRSRWAGVPVEVAGWVPDVGKELAAATIAVCPIRTGSGMKIKVLEAMASGTPVVATSQAIEGLEAVDRVHCLVADSPEAFTANVAELLADRAQQQALATAARALVEERYSWEASAALLERVYATVIG